MATTIYNEPWSPSNINCNWKPEKLSRYSFITNLIDFDANGNQLGYMQSGNLPESNQYMNLTDYISVEENSSYVFQCEEGVEQGVRFVAFFNSNKTFISSIGYLPNTVTSLKGFFQTPSDCIYIRVTLYTQAWNNCILKSTSLSSLSSEGKDKTPLNIIENKVGTQIYKDLHFEVYVKEEALIKNFVDCFNLKSFQAFPRNVEENYSAYYTQNSLILNYNTEDYYDKTYPNKFPAFQPNHVYKKGDLITGTIYVYSQKYICIKDHTSTNDFYNDWVANNWASLSISDGGWLYIDKSIKETNYSENIGFPFVGSLIFKNLWGCDMLNYLNTYVNKSYLAISYYDFFAKNLRFNNTYYDKFFQQGYFSDISGTNNASDLEGFGVRLIRGEDFKNDEILGDTVLNNYFSFAEKRNSIPSSWKASSDAINKTYFDGKISNPFDHWYTFQPIRSIPFFKEKIFKDFKIELVLQREDKLGNLFQRIVDLPILVTFTNNLIKCYFRNWNDFGGTNIYTSEYLNSNAVNKFFYEKGKGTSGVNSKIVVWCPNVKRLTVSSTIFNPARVRNFPKLVNIKYNDSSADGQTCILAWTFDDLDVGEKITAIHSLEYSDGENYDKFIFIEEITRNK